MATIREIGNDTLVDRILNRDFVSITRKGYVEVGEDNICLPIYYRDYEEKIRKFEVYDDDVFITGHPKTGTTWTQEMIWLIVNNLDYATASKEPIFTRAPLLELNALFDYQPDGPNADFRELIKNESINTEFLTSPFEFIVKSRRPRCIKSHLHWSLLPEQIRNGTKQPKIITVIRNAADTCVSLYYHSQTVESYKGTFEDFCELFLAGRVCFGPFWKQVFSYWEQRDRPNILFIKYMEMKDNLPGVIRKVSQFLGKSLSAGDIAKLAEHLSFESMKKNPSINREPMKKAMVDLGISVVVNDHIRSGSVGGYKSKMTPETVARFEAWSKENLAGTELSME